MKTSLITFVLLLMLCAAASGAGDEYLSTGEVVAIGGGSLVIYGSGLWANNFDSTKTSLINGPLPGDRSIQRLLGGQYYQSKGNFLDSRLGSAATPIAGAVLLTSIDIGWPAENGGKGLSQDLFLYLSGLLSTRGVTDLVKSTVARPRPYLEMVSAGSMDYSSKGFAYDHNSFFSGHTSSAFFVATFLNKRVRSTMRREMNQGEYHDWRWLPPAIFYSWSSFVGWSRIHAWRHYFSDVAIGALAGWLVGELFYSFNTSDGDENGDSVNSQMLFRITLRI